MTEKGGGRGRGRVGEEITRRGEFTTNSPIYNELHKEKGNIYHIITFPPMAGGN